MEISTKLKKETGIALTYDQLSTIIHRCVLFTGDYKYVHETIENLR